MHEHMYNTTILITAICNTAVLKFNTVKNKADILVWNSKN